MFDSLSRRFCFFPTASCSFIFYFFKVSSKSLLSTRAGLLINAAVPLLPWSVSLSPGSPVFYSLTPVFKMHVLSNSAISRPTPSRLALTPPPDLLRAHLSLDPLPHGPLKWRRRPAPPLDLHLPNPTLSRAMSRQMSLPSPGHHL